jgi:hypothetical protein
MSSATRPLPTLAVNGQLLRDFLATPVLELLWVADAAQATGARTRRTRLWERCSHQGPEASPFGILFRANHAAVVNMLVFSSIAFSFLAANVRWF